jgi:hypothetical protein
LDEGLSVFGLMGFEIDGGLQVRQGVRVTTREEVGQAQRVASVRPSRQKTRRLFKMDERLFWLASFYQQITQHQVRVAVIGFETQGGFERRPRGVRLADEL